jgi:hypothetical protein
LGRGTIGDHEEVHSLTPEECEMVRSEVRQIASSPYFRNSKRYPAFLTCIVERTLQGGGADIKERTIGIEVFGRPADYDTNSDPIVRNTASEVRKRLSLYHAESAHGTVSIHLPPGSYQPEFRFAPPQHATEESARPTESNDVEHLVVAPPDVELEVKPNSRLVTHAMWAIALLLVIAGIVVWSLVVHFRKNAFDKLWAGFLNPAQSVLIAVPQAPPPAATGGPLVKGALDEKALSTWIKDNPDVAAEDVTAIVHATKPLMQHNIPYSIQLETNVTLSDLRDRPVLLIGGPSNAWATKLLAPLRFHFNSVGSLHVEDSQNPQSRSCDYTLDSNASPHPQVLADCAIIARFRDSITGGMVMIIAGAGRNGTEAAGEFIATSALLKSLDKRLPSGWRDLNLEVVLKTDVIDGKTGEPAIVAAYTW